MLFPQNVSWLVFIQTPLSVMLGVSPSSPAAIFDSHALDANVGAKLAVLKTPYDWEALGTYMGASVTGPFKNVQFVLRDCSQAL